MMYPVWVNGSEGGCIDPADRGLAYGDGLFETLRVEGGRAVFVEEHFSRLFASASALGIPVDGDKLRGDFFRLLSLCPLSCVIKIIVTRGSSGRGYLPDETAIPTVVFSAHALPVYPETHSSEGIHAAVCSLRLAHQPLLAGHKHLNRLEQVLLRRELAGLGADEALVCDSDGHVVEGVFSNVFLVHGSKLCTPTIRHAGIRGVMRAVLMREAAAVRLQVEEGYYGPDDFQAADEVFFCNSVNGVWPVQSLAGRHWRPGSITRRLQAVWLEQLGL